MQFDGHTICRKNIFRSCTVKPAVFSFPGFLNVFNHSGIGEHNIGPDSIHLIGMTLAAGLGPEFRVRWINWAEHGLVGDILIFGF